MVRNISNVVGSLEGEDQIEGYRCWVYVECLPSVLTGLLSNLTPPLVWISVVGASLPTIC